LEAVLGKIDLGWNKQNGRIGILFGDARVQSFFDAKKHDKNA
jgi:hypothetical protein